MLKKKDPPETNILHLKTLRLEDDPFLLGFVWYRIAPYQGVHGSDAN